MNPELLEETVRTALLSCLLIGFFIGAGFVGVLVLTLRYRSLQRRRIFFSNLQQDLNYKPRHYN